MNLKKNIGILTITEKRNKLTIYFYITITLYNNQHLNYNEKKEL